MWAAELGNVAAIERLVASGANLEAVDEVHGQLKKLNEQDGNTALSWACFGGKMESVQALLNKGSRLQHVNHVCAAYS
jgi:ankyrin repeat protein